MKALPLLSFVGLLAGCATLPTHTLIQRKEMKTLEIRWQRLVDDKGETCDRCGATETAVEIAVKSLKRSMAELDIDVILKKSALDTETFKQAPLESNRIWIADRPIEAWLSASTGESQCCAACGDSDCRTLTVDGKTYEAIPSELIVKAGLMAAVQLLDDEPASGCSSSGCGPPATQGCCPGSS